MEKQLKLLQHYRNTISEGIEQKMELSVETVMNMHHEKVTGLQLVIMIHADQLRIVMDVFELSKFCYSCKL